MKKLFWIVSLALLPLTAHAQSGGDQVLQAAADELKPAFCANDLKKAIPIVEKCYESVDQGVENSNINQCVIEDLFVFGVIKMKQKQYTNNFQTDPYVKLSYAQNAQLGLRLSKHPNFTDNLINSKDKEQIGGKIAIKMATTLQRDNCFDLDKIK